MSETKVSSQYSINWYDIKKGLLTAAISPVFSIVLPLLQKGIFTFDWKLIIGTAISGCLSYLSLMFFMPAKVYVKDADKKDIEAVQKGEAEVKLIKT